MQQKEELSDEDHCLGRKEGDLQHWSQFLTEGVYPFQ
jgi:hypothetical protein